jgi:hypothetical protein
LMFQLFELTSRFLLLLLISSTLHSLNSNYSSLSCQDIPDVSKYPPMSDFQPCEARPTQPRGLESVHNDFCLREFTIGKTFHDDNLHERKIKGQEGSNFYASRVMRLHRAPEAFE